MRNNWSNSEYRTFYMTVGWNSSKKSLSYSHIKGRILFLIKRSLRNRTIKFNALWAASVFLKS